MANVSLPCLGIMVSLGLVTASFSPAQVSAANSASDSNDVVAGMVEDSYHLLDHGDPDGALREVDAALQIDSHNASIFELRGAIYMEKKLWDRAERDYNAALAISPSTAGFKFKLAEIKFLQKDYDNAKPRYVVIENDENLGDLALYKAFLCDLLGGHEERSAADLVDLDKSTTKPSYYYANAASALVHNKLKDATSWVTAAQQSFGNSTADLYLSPLINANDLHPAIVTFETKTYDLYDQVKAFAEDEGLRVSAPKGWVTIPYDQLPDDLSPFPPEMRKKILAKRSPPRPVGPDSGLVDFITKDGKKYEQVRVAVESSALQVLTPDGWINVPYDQLPGDLSSWPKDLQKKIEDQRQHATSVDNDQESVSFSTKDGKKFEQVRVAVWDVGLRVLNEDGWITIPYDQLPEQLDSFPDDLQKQIKAKRQTAHDESINRRVVSFTTKKGEKYDQVRTMVENYGLRVLTSDGWITVTFDQLPDDLSSFPADVQQQINLKRPSAGVASLGFAQISFTTKKGKVYDQVRISAQKEGLQVLTPDGWVIVPYNELPDDLSKFPASVLRQLEAKPKTDPETETASDWITFNSKTGKLYDQVKVIVGSDGLHVLTSNGWTTLPYDQVPDDLSPFPPPLRPQIVEKEKALLAKNNVAPSTIQTPEQPNGTKADNPTETIAPMLDSTPPGLRTK